MKGKVIIISGPSGVGKSTLIKRVAERLGAVVSVSATTRRPGPAERHGEHYYFYSRQDFETLRREDRLLEWAEYLGNYYGTPRDPVEQALNRGTDVILGIETRGAKEVVKIFPDAIIICLSPPSDEELERRLRDRARDDEASIARRVANARKELALARESGIYRHWVVNDVLDRAVDETVSICKQESYKR